MKTHHFGSRLLVKDLVTGKQTRFLEKIPSVLPRVHFFAKMDASEAHFTVHHPGCRNMTLKVPLPYQVGETVLIAAIEPEYWEYTDSGFQPVPEGAVVITAIDVIQAYDEHHRYNGVPSGDPYLCFDFTTAPTSIPLR